MMPSSTTWARESARLAFFSVAMSERKDQALLGLIEQTNNAVETYLNLRQSAPPALFGKPGPAPTAPLPTPPATSRPLSITSGTAPPIIAEGVAWPLPPATAPLRPATKAPAAPVTGNEAEWTPTPEVARQFCLAFAAVEPRITEDHDRHLALYDVCAGRGLAEAARDRRVDVGSLRRAVQRLKAVGPKAYLDAAIGAAP